MCSGRVDLEFILRAFANGQDGVFIGGCKLDECNYVTHGNYDALANTHIARKILEHIGLNPNRLRTEFMSGADGNLLAEYTDDFARQIKELGPLGKSEGMDADTVKFKLEAARKLVPYMRLAERERLRVPFKSKQTYTEFFESSEMNALFGDIFSDKLAVSQIMLLLKDNPLSTGDIAEKLGLNPSDVSRHMISSSRHGMVKYDTDSKCYQRVQ
ncbi:BamF3: DNA-binding domain modulated methyl-viologen-reducing hydrogenase, delta subunit [Desulfobacula toluolica Tol2]|uniref:BamF1:coenzyme F420 non-reducing hydrogenase, delta subunit n=3 Tax=Desulfobacteraceae TaxID=213119 RepID=K0N370_DESTT|nr:BamF1:coenzyme F420 non-reducing hydrogenase, delta subunit [Desulfobacula toluolica Tol2]CCK82509.1 BamF3: DNA-binding domain modulated methyl-viologen-reducing hydrogenase, delta subunit [Desulfobacula toluolica Tol2]SDU67490.1 tungsten-dependent benzoyl-CoA reductase-related protein bamF [Desulfobacula phenolica]